MIKEYKKLYMLTDRVLDDLISISDLLQEIMEHPSKDFLVTFKGRKFDLNKPSTIKEAIAKIKEREELSKLLLEFCLKKFFKRYKKNYRIKEYDFSDIWDDILCFTRGADPRDHQFEKVEVEVTPVTDENGEIVKALPLNMDNYQVRNEVESAS